MTSAGHSFGDLVSSSSFTGTEQQQALIIIIMLLLPTILACGGGGGKCSREGEEPRANQREKEGGGKEQAPCTGDQPSKHCHANVSHRVQASQGRPKGFKGSGTREFGTKKNNCTHTTWPTIINSPLSLFFSFTLLADGPEPDQHAFSALLEAWKLQEANRQRRVQPLDHRRRSLSPSITVLLFLFLFLFFVFCFLFSPTHQS